ncbi:MAG: mismatch-specific DNA-glycosylase [bacterium]|nr:mismatch-specific DNA-glycosylase [bacterium]
MTRLPLFRSNQRCWFVGHNPSPRSFLSQSYYAHPSNKFWQLLYDAGFTDRHLTSECAEELFNYGLGCIDLSERSTVSANELTKDEMEVGLKKILDWVNLLQPQWLAANGLTIGYIITRKHFQQSYGDWGKLIYYHPERITESCETRLWVLPSSSGRAGRYRGKPLTYIDKLNEWKAFKNVLFNSTLLSSNPNEYQ